MMTRNYASSNFMFMHNSDSHNFAPKMSPKIVSQFDTTHSFVTPGLAVAYVLKKEEKTIIPL